MSETLQAYRTIAVAAERVFEIHGARDSTAEDIYDVVIGVLAEMEASSACPYGTGGDEGELD